MKLLQFEIWHDCPNRCSFCSLGDLSKKTSDDEKISNILKVKNILQQIDWCNYDELGIIGGELNIPLTSSLKKEFMSLIDYVIHELIIKSKIKKFYFMSSLMNDSPIVYEIIYKFIENHISDKIMINTSYDTIGRFNTTTKHIWDNNITKITNDDIDIHIEVILTNDFIKKYINEDKEVINLLSKYNVDFIRPVVGVGKKREDMPFDFFPERKKFFEFLSILKKKHPVLLEKFFNLKQRAVNIYVMPLNKIVQRDLENGNEDISRPTLECGHSDVFSIYSDSNKCVLCDIEKFKKI